MARVLGPPFSFAVVRAVRVRCRGQGASLRCARARGTGPRRVSRMAASAANGYVVPFLAPSADVTWRSAPAAPSWRWCRTSILEVLRPSSRERVVTTRTMAEQRFSAGFVAIVGALVLGLTACQSGEAPEHQDDGGEARAACTPESDAKFCWRLGKNCDAVGFDNCGTSRSVACGSCSRPESCGGAGQAGVCGIDRCPATCDSPPAAQCVDTGRASFDVIRFAANGSCDDPDRGECSYPGNSEHCAEDCQGGRCVQTPCSLAGFECNGRGVGCKLATPTELRCLPLGDSPRLEGSACGDVRIPEAPDTGRCASHLRCVWPANFSSPACAYICRTHEDCAGLGLRGQHQCVLSPGVAFGYCM